MLVLGLDGADYDFLNTYKSALPTIEWLFDKCNMSPLMCDVTPIHTSPSWTCIFSGMGPRISRRLGFDPDDKVDTVHESLPLPWLWNYANNPLVYVPDKLHTTAIAFDKNKLPLMGLAVTTEEINEELDTVFAAIMRALRSGEHDLIAVVVSATDHAGHYYGGRLGLGDDYWNGIPTPNQIRMLVEFWRRVDAKLQEVMSHVEQHKSMPPWVILSDHGMGLNGVHSEKGIFACSEPPPFPAGVRGVYGLLRGMLHCYKTNFDFVKWYEDTLGIYPWKRQDELWE